MVGVITSRTSSYPYSTTTDRIEKTHFTDSGGHETWTFLEKIVCQILHKSHLLICDEDVQMKETVHLTLACDAIKFKSEMIDHFNENP